MRYSLLFILASISFSCTEELNKADTYNASELQVNFTVNGKIVSDYNIWFYATKNDFKNNTSFESHARVGYDVNFYLGPEIDSVWIKCLKIERDSTYEAIKAIKMPKHNDNIFPSIVTTLFADSRKTSLKIKKISFSKNGIPKNKIVGGSLYSGYKVDFWDNNLADDITNNNPDIFIKIGDDYQSAYFDFVDYDYSQDISIDIPDIIINKDSQIPLKLFDYDFNISDDDVIDSIVISFPYNSNQYIYPNDIITINYYSIDIEWL